MASKYLRAVLGATCLCTAAAAAAVVSTFDSILDFPQPATVVTSMSTGELAFWGITSSGTLTATTGLIGNQHAPVNGPCDVIVSSAQPAIYAFDQGRSYVGFACADADYTEDDPAVITLNVYGASDEHLGTYVRTLLPANSFNEQNRTAVFLGIEADQPIHTVAIRTSIDQTTIIDNLTFEDLP